MRQDSDPIELTRSNHYRRWVQAGFAAAAVGYLAVGAASHRPLAENRDLWVGLACLSLYLLARTLPSVAGYLGAGVVWLELTFSIATSPGGLHSLGTTLVALPVWAMAVSLFWRTRWALFAVGVTLTALPLLVFLVNPTYRRSGSAGDDLVSLFVAEIAVAAAAWLVHLFMRSFRRAVRNERINASKMIQLLNDAPDAMIAVENDLIVAFNCRAEEYFEVNRESVLGCRLDQLSFSSFFEGKFSLEQPLKELQVAGRTLEMRVQHLEHEDEPAQILYVFRDVTKVFAESKRRQELQNQLDHAQRLEALGQLAGGIAHDFNNLLTAIIGAADLLSDAKDPRVRELGKTIAMASNRGASLTKQLLTFARREVVQEQVIDLREAIEDSVGLIEQVLGERIALDLDLQEGCLIRGDHGQLEQILLNLAANARDAMQNVGTFTVRSRAEPQLVKLMVQDTGSGMDKETAKRIFEPFFTTKARGRGTGLGLSTVHGIVSNWKGRIEVTSAPGEGATFEITWPRAADDRPIRSLAVPKNTPLSLQGHLLLVEDDEAARGTTQRLLHRGGLEVTTATSAEEALSLLRDGLDPDIVVTDVIMRGMTGVELGKRLAKTHPHLPVLFVSGYVDDVLGDWPWSTTHDLLLKPFTAKQLLEHVERKLQKRLDGKIIGLKG